MGGKYSKPEPKSIYYEKYVSAMPSMSGKAVAITGSTTGLGYAAAVALARKGAHVIMLNRPSERADKALAQVKEAAGKATHVEAAVSQVDCDLQDFASVRAAAEEVTKLVGDGGLYALCNNAGVMMLPEKESRDGYDVQMQTNHLSHFLLTSKLLPTLEKAAAQLGEARIINHSSGARRQPATKLNKLHLQKSVGKLGGDGAAARMERYHQTKLANVVFTLALQDKLAERSSKVKALVAHPGLSASNLQVTTAESGMSMGMSVLMQFSQSQDDGCLPMLECVCAPDLQSGAFFGPKNRGLIGTLIGDGVTGPPAPIQPEPMCTDPESKKMLWEQSEEAVGSFF